jgi:hypothetical protein
LDGGAGDLPCMATLIAQLQAIEVRTEKMRAAQKRAEPKRPPVYWFQAEEIKPRVASDPNDLDNTPIDTIFAWYKGIFVVHDAVVTTSDTPSFDGQLLLHVSSAQTCTHVHSHEHLVV